MPAENLKVAANSVPNAVAGAISRAIRANKEVEIQVIGAGALNQAIKALIIARGYTTPAGYDLVFRPSFKEINIDNEERTSICLAVVSMR